MVTTKIIINNHPNFWMKSVRELGGKDVLVIRMIAAFYNPKCKKLKYVKYLLQSCNLY